MWCRIWGLCGAWVFLSALALADQPPVPSVIGPMTGPVVEEIAWLSGGDRSAIVSTLTELRERANAQGVVLIAADTRGMSVEEFAIKVADAWKLGDKKSDRGFVLVVVPSDRALRLEVGYGLEEFITDVEAKRILSDHIVPLLRNGYRGQAVVAGLEAMAEKLGVPTEGGARTSPRKTVRFSGMGWFFFLLIFFLVLRIFTGSRLQPRTGFGWGRRGPGGGGWGGGFGGGGFGGGGFGGGFGGGGASSRW